LLFFFSSRRRHTRFSRDWSSDVCSSDLSINLMFQSFSQLPKELVSILLGNVGTIVSFRVGYSDAELLARQMIGKAISLAPSDLRSEERRVGKECRYRCATSR